MESSLVMDEKEYKIKEEHAKTHDPEWGRGRATSTSLFRTLGIAVSLVLGEPLGSLFQGVGNGLEILLAKGVGVVGISIRIEVPTLDGVTTIREDADTDVANTYLMQVLSR